MSDRDSTDDARPKQVVIFGAGIAGLTAAHELAERGFEVDVYEAAPASPWDRVATGAPCAVGGMAKTQWTRTSRRFGLPHTGEIIPTEQIQLIPDVLVDPKLASPRASGSGDSEADTESAAEIDALRQLCEDRSRSFAAEPVLRTDPFVRRQLWSALRKTLALIFDLRPTSAQPLQIEVRGYSHQPNRPDAFDYSLEDLERLSAATDAESEKERKALEERDDLRYARTAAAALEDALLQAGIDEELLREPGRELFRIRAMGLGLREDWTAPDHKRNFVRFTVKEDWLPGEHGFRFFPAFYRNLFDTMRRTPIANDAPQYTTGSVYAESYRTVLDNIIPTELMGMTTDGRSAPFGFRRQAVGSLEEIFEQVTGMLKAMGFPIADLNRFELKLFKYMTSSTERRTKEYENLTWWEFLEADRFSPSFRRYLDSTAEALVAMNARKSDARTYGNVSVQMLQDQMSSGQRSDGTLNGPTSIAWFDHWRRYLQHQGVTFHQGTLDRFEWHDRRPWAVVTRADKKKVPVRIVGRDYFVLALPVKEMERIAKGVAQQIEKARSAAGDGGVPGDVPTRLYPDFERLCKMDWGDPCKADPGGSLDHMAGIQFFFDGDVKILSGHVLYPDTPWRLSAVGQPQFWRAKRGWWSGYRGILSVDISNWHNSGDERSGKESAKPGQAWDKTRDEIAREVWNQICGSGGPPTTAERRRGSDPGPSELPRPTLYHLDENIVFKDKHIERNASPLLINRKQEFHRRPGKPGEYELSYECIALAGTCMQTYTRLTTMESANESARHAVNAILQAAGFKKEEWCAIYDPERHEPPDLRLLCELDSKLLGYGLPHFVDILDLTSIPKPLLRPDPDLSSLDLSRLLKEAHRGK